MTIGVYKITNTENGKSYIGQSIDIERRFRQHQYDANNPKSQNYAKPLYQAMRSFGIEKFTFEILEECKYEALNNKEIFYVNKFMSFKNGYNGTVGGRNANFRNGKKKIKLTDNDIEVIRNDYANKVTLECAYLQKYADKITLEEFFEIWIGENYNSIKMEVYNNENIDFHKENDEIDYIPKYYIDKISYKKAIGERMPMAYSEFSIFLSYDIFKLLWGE